MMMTRGLSLAALGLGLMITGCGGSGDDTPSDTATPGAGTPTAEATPTATATAAPVAKVNVTFTVDTTTTADGVNMLAEVLDGEEVFIVGDMKPDGNGCSFDGDDAEDYPCWKPQRSELAMTETSTDGIYNITLQLTPGSVVEYKYVKTTDDVENNGWGNGVKDYIPTSEQACPDFDEATGGLWEIQNLTYTVPDADATAEVYVAEAWRDYASGTFGYPACD